MIEVDNLFFRYDGNAKPALRDIHLTIADGEYVAVIGPNGCGKTTLVQHFNALHLPASGTVRIDGMPTSDPRYVKEIRRLVGMVFQNPDNQIVGMTVEEDIAFGPENLGLPSREIGRRVEESLDAVGLRSIAERPPHTLSGGEKRLVAVAGVLAMRPRHIAFDEPTSYLDPSAKKRIIEVIRNLNKGGLTVIHITHDMDEVAAADRIVVMNEGRIHQTGTPEEICSGVERLRELGLGIPKATELLWNLKKRWGNIRTDILTIEGACDEITAWLLRERPITNSGQELSGGRRDV
jgi:biotin transport system ATP-binding protein